MGTFDARLSITNLFDRVYQLRDGTGVGLEAPEYLPRRGLYLTLSKHFQ
jgi:outer membrane receptor protein involved in Fe transport